MEIKNFKPASSTYDAWKVNPPCQYTDSYCNVNCPYYDNFNECCGL